MGPCDVKGIDLAGQERQVYLCQDTHTQDWKIGPGCNADRVPDHTEWYTVCGKEHNDQPTFLAAVSALAAAGNSRTGRPSESGARRRGRKRENDRIAK